MLAAILGGVAVTGLLGWTLWTLTGESALESTAQGTVVRTPGEAQPRAPSELPVAPDSPDRGGSTAAPKPMEVEPPPPQGPDGVLGLVLDAATGDPVPVFQVHVLYAEPGDPLSRLAEGPSKPFHVLTGVFFVPQDPGRWDVVVQAPGYLPSIQTGVNTPAREREPLRFELARGAGIVGLVLDEALMPVAGVDTFLHVTELFDAADKPPLIRTGKTGADGRFSYSPLPNGEYAVALLEPDNAVDRTGGLRVSGDTVKIDMFLRPRHELTVTVQAEDGSPLADVLVEARSTLAHFARGKTNENGMVLLEYLPDGDYTLKATLSGMPPHSEEFELFGGSSQQARWVTLSP